MIRRIAATGAAIAAALLAGAAATGRTDPAPAAAAQTLQPLSVFKEIRDRRERSLALFQEVGKVIQHPRCLNCHPATDVPTQTDLMTPHEPLVVRGDGGIGAAGMRCITCHHDANFDPANVPGHPKWHLAPPEMAWQGKSLGAICEQIKDNRRNGGMSMKELVHHMAEDDLVGWGWHPGGDRTPAPGTQKQFGELFRAWADSGAHCPTS